uniref:Uncharacterized protein n=1 Tax=Glossina morsitans morsitans TaxID=37546 RepID=A0A1B0G9G9_GLOMM
MSCQISYLTQNGDVKQNLKIECPNIEFFGMKNTRYDYSKENPVEAGQKLSSMDDQKEKMERNII